MIAEWSDYFVAQAGAAAALAGLLFVAVSINLARILEFPNLPGRAAETLILLLALLIIAMFGLVPGQPAIAFGAELTAVGCLTVVITAVIQWRAPKSSYERMSLRVLASQSPAVLWVVAGVCLLLGNRYGLYLNLAATIVGFVSVAQSSWVLLVEIQR